MLVIELCVRVGLVLSCAEISAAELQLQQQIRSLLPPVVPNICHNPLSAEGGDAVPPGFCFMYENATAAADSIPPAQVLNLCVTCFSSEELTLKDQLSLLPRMAAGHWSQICAFLEEHSLSCTCMLLPYHLLAHARSSWHSGTLSLGQD